MRRRREALPLAATLVALVASLTAPEHAPAAADPEPAWRTARVTYLTSRTAYLDAGSDAGIAPGMRLEVVREGLVVAVLRADDVSSRRTACSIESGEGAISVGDAARFLPAVSPEAAGAAAAAEAPAAETWSPAASRVRRLGLRGRVGVRYLYVDDGMEGGSQTSQPALDLRLDGTRIGGSGFDVEVDVRSRLTYRTAPDGTTDSDDRTAIYRLATAWQGEGSPWRFTAGRQMSPALSSVSIFDGAQGEYRASRWSLGAFTGTQPDPEDLGYDSSIREHGGYAQWRNAPEALRRWALTTGLIGSYEEGEISREYAYVQGFYAGPRLGAWVTQEVDVNRGWKADFEDQSVSPTSTFANFRFKATDALSLLAGYDNRRNVRLYRDRITPETDFDDQYRNGVWLGVDTRFGRHFRAGVDVKRHDGGDLGSADSATLVLSVMQLTRAGIHVGTRSTRYTNESIEEGWLHSISLGAALGSRWHAEITGGVRDETSAVDASLDDQVTWYGVEFDVSLGRGWFLSTTAETSDGDTEQLDQVYTSVTWRF